MSVAGASSRNGGWVRAIISWICLAGVAAAITLMFLAMRAVIEGGGSCASGGPYVVANPCPDGAIPAMMIGIFGGLFAVGGYIAAVIRLPGPNFVLLFWCALFLALGWNFWEYGLNPPDGFGDGVQWGFLIPGAMFAVMGGLPLILILTKGFVSTFWRGEATPGAESALGSLASMRGVAVHHASPPQPFVSSSFGQAPGQSFDQSWPTPPPAAGASGDIAAHLERLAHLHQQGALTADEFAAAKQRLLSGGI